MALTSATEMPAVPQQRRAPMYFPGNDEERMPAEPPASADFGFADFLDVINPLQHIPIVSTIYRAITGDTISPAANVMGSALFGGPAGVFAAAATEMFSEMTGGRPDDHLLAMFDGGEAENTSVAAAPAPMAAPAAAAPLLAAEESPPLPPPVAAPDGPSALFQALQTRRAGTDRDDEQRIAATTGRDIRSYFAEAAHYPKGPPPKAPAATPDDEAAGAAGREREAMRAAVAAAHARGIEMLRQQGQVQGASAAQETPDWFTERMLDGLAKYREGSRLGDQPATGSMPLVTG